MKSFKTNLTKVLKNNVFYTTFESGIGEKIQMEFQIKPFDLAKIQKTPIYINWIIQHPNNNNIKAFLNDKLQIASLKAKSRENGETIASEEIELNMDNSGMIRKKTE